MDQNNIIEFLNNLIRQALMQQQQQPYDPLAFIPTNDVITRSAQNMAMPARNPVFGFGNSFDRNLPQAPSTHQAMEFLPGLYGQVYTGGMSPSVNTQPLPEGQYPGVDRNLDRRYPTNVGGIFPSSLVDYYAAPQPVRTFDNPNVNMPSRVGMTSVRSPIAPRTII